MWICMTHIFVLTGNWVFESVFYKGTPKKPLLFETVLQLQEINTEGRLIIHVVHIEGIRMIEVGTDNLSIGNYLGGMSLYL